jgi:BON domain
MHGQHTGRNGRQRPFEERTRHDEHQQAGGRSERQARQRDQEQVRAGYPAREWEREPQGYRNVRSEPHWDPSYRPVGSQFHPEDRYAERYPGERERRDAYERAQGSSGPGFGGGGRGSEQSFRHERWRADDSFTEPSEYYEPTSYEPGGFPRGLRPADARDWRSERDLREPRHHSELGQRLEDAGRRLVGKVKRLVRNPKNYKRSDERIREDICDRLAVSAEIDPSELEVSVSAGEVTLTGFVADRQMKFVAEDITDDVPGVHEIHNQLRIRRPETSVANTNAETQPELSPTMKRN